MSPGVAAEQEDVVAFLERPESYPEAAGAVERIDTHGAFVFLAGERAYKLKRAVRYPYLDYSTLALRERACRQELSLNRRTAPTIYEAVVAVRRGGDGTLRLDGEGETVDWLVRMRRFDQSGLFDRMAEEGRLTDTLMERLAEAVADFHAEAEPRPEAAPMDGLISENRETLAASPELFDAAAVGEWGRLAAEALDRLRPLLDARRRSGKVRRCHGDLHLRNVCLVDGEPTLFDAIEFSEAIAETDVLYDLAFLLMDLERLQLRRFANRVLNRYLARTGDLEGLAALPLFLSLRAGIRAKVDAAAAEAQHEASAAEAQRREARAFLQLALDFLAPPPSRLVAVGGLSGTGKSTLAALLAPELGPAPGAVVLRSDLIRKELAGVPAEQRLPEEAYGASASREVYAELVRRAGILLQAGHGAVLDAVFGRPEEKEAAAALARRHGIALEGLWLEAPAATLRERVSGRRGDASDATAEVVEKQLGWRLSADGWRVVDASRSPEGTASRASAALRQTQSEPTAA